MVWCLPGSTPSLHRSGPTIGKLLALASSNRKNFSLFLHFNDYGRQRDKLPETSSFSVISCRTVSKCLLLSTRRELSRLYRTTDLVGAVMLGNVREVSELPRTVSQGGQSPLRPFANPCLPGTSTQAKSIKTWGMARNIEMVKSSYTKICCCRVRTVIRKVSFFTRSAPHL